MENEVSIDFACGLISNLGGKPCFYRSRLPKFGKEPNMIQGFAPEMLL
jgi:hypothetical protein